jgi:hypothetical protein
MYLTEKVKTLKQIQPSRVSPGIGVIGVLMVGFAFLPAFAKESEKTRPVKLAVFAFELEDVSPASSLMGRTTSSAASMDNVSSEARRMLTESGRYDLIDVSKADAKPATQKSLRQCDGCEAGIALRLGAEQSLLGVVTRVTQTDYYVQIVIRDARTGKILDEQSANFAGGDDGWASGARMLIKHQVLVSAD